MAQMPDGCVDLVVTSPPYNLGYEKPPTGKDWARGIDYGVPDNIEESKYQAWQGGCVIEMLRIVGNRGSVIYNHKPRQRNGFVILPHQWLLSLPIHQEIVWDRRGTQNNEPSFLAPVDERLFWLCASGKPRICGDSNYPSVIRWKYRIGTEHPAPFPEELVWLFVQMLTWPEDIVFDPFMGSGTTAVVADRLGRKFFGCDINPDYVEMALERLEKDRAGRQLSLL